MITVEEALELIKTNTPQAGFIEKDVNNCLNDTLFEDIISPINLPPFNQSAMDGYAIRIGNFNSYKVIGETKAGDSHEPSLEIGEAIRIFTGALVPETANSVVMQEKTQVKGNDIVLTEDPKLNSNIRMKGEQLLEGTVGLTKGTQINPATIGFLNMLGLNKVKVYNKPKVSILVTGNELISPGNHLPKGKVYECNGSMIKAALAQLGINGQIEPLVKDTLQDTINFINKALVKSDILILTGGISVGDYDFVKPALESIGVETIFYKVRQKPGKPLYFGKLDEKLIFALPGNPAASLMCFYQYITETLNILVGGKNSLFPQITCVASNDFKKKAERAQFLWANTNFKNFEILPMQNSSMLKTFTMANALIYLPLEKSEIKKGELISIKLIGATH